MLGKGNMMNNKVITSKIVFLSVVILLGGCYVQEEPPPNPKANPEKAMHTYIQLGLEFIALGKTQDAKSRLARALEINPKSPEANAAIAYMYQHDAEPALAEEYFKKALSYDEKYTTGRNNYGMFLYSQGRYEEALAQLKMASDDTLYNKRAQVFYNIGTVYLKMNKTAEADAAFNKSRILDNDNPETYFEIAQMNFDSKEYAQADAAYSNYLKLKPQQDARGLWLGIRLSQALGRKDDELKYASMLRENYPTSEQYFMYIDATGKR